MTFSLDTHNKISKFCSVLSKFYNHTLAKYFGIGKSDLSWRDLLISYMYMNNRFLSIPDSYVEPNTKFIGVILADNTLIPGETSATPKFYINDQDAYDNGIKKNEIYYLDINNTYGSPYGTPKKLVEDVQ